MILHKKVEQPLRIKIDFYHIFLSSSFLHGDLPANYSDQHPEPSHQNYLTGDSRHELIITMNITSMMVLASIYLSVSASLRKTQDIKPVEVWLLFNLAYPFLVILVNIAINVSLKCFCPPPFNVPLTRTETQLPERKWRPWSKVYG